MPRIAGRAKAALLIRELDGSYRKFDEAMAPLDVINPQLVAWANRATHTFSASKSEAEVVIDNCEKALGVFTCLKCQSPVWSRKIADDKVFECGCSHLRCKKY
jgi:hypothetical protein